jgi:hypothetical protein
LVTGAVPTADIEALIAHGVRRDGRDYKTLSKRPDRDGYQQFLVNLVSSTLGKETCASLSIHFHPAAGGNTTQELGTRESVEYVQARWPGLR